MGSEKGEGYIIFDLFLELDCLSFLGEQKRAFIYIFSAPKIYILL